MAAVAVLAGVFFVVMGAWGVTHAERSPESPAGGWLSFPAGRRVGGVITILVGVGVIVGALTQPL